MRSQKSFVTVDSRGGGGLIQNIKLPFRKIVRCKRSNPEWSPMLFPNYCVETKFGNRKGLKANSVTNHRTSPSSLDSNLACVLGRN